MGLFTNIRKTKSDFDDSDDWLLELQEDDDHDEVALPAPPPEPVPFAASTAVPVPAPPPPGTGVTAWHLPDLGPDRDVTPIIPAAVEAIVSPRTWDESPTPAYEPFVFDDEPVWSLPDDEVPVAWEAAGWIPEDDVPAGGPDSSDAAVMLEILGLFPGASWAEVRDAHRELIEGHCADAFADAAHADLAEEIRREMNTAYAALRLMAASH